MGFKKYSIQLTDLPLGTAIIAAGGVVFVAQTGTPDKRVIYNATTEIAMTNPMTPTRGKIEFKVLDTVADVDLYIQTPGGQFLQLYAVKASGANEILVDTMERRQMMVVPFSITDTAAATETATGFTIPTVGAVQPSPLIRVTAIDATETIDVGTLSTDSGDADGFIAAVSVGTLGLAKPTLATAGITLGVLLWVQDSANAGDEAPEQNISMAGKQITYTLTAGSDTGKGFISLPVQLAA